MATALERLALNQSTQGWARHLKAPDVFKPDGRDAELKLWGDWKFGFLNYVKGWDPSMAASMDMVENNVDANYNFEDMTDETKATGDKGQGTGPAQPVVPHSDSVRATAAVRGLGLGVRAHFTKVASILLACPLQIRQHLHLWLTDTTTYEQLKDRIIQLEAVTTKWDSANSLMLPTRTTGDEATP